MLIVPELKTVFILVPRTGTGTLYREMLRVYPRAMLLYRHMEADGIPTGYDRWKRIGFVRHPLSRLRSLHRFMQVFTGGAQVRAQKDVDRIAGQASRSFEDWLLNNQEPWTIPYDLSGDGDWWPILTRRHATPENKVSQWQYLRPDLGTEVRKFENLRASLIEWGLNTDVVNNRVAQPRVEAPPSAAVTDHLHKYCAWDLEQGCLQ